MLKVTRAGTVLGEFGNTSMRPTVKRSTSVSSSISSCRAAIIATRRPHSILAAAKRRGAGMARLALNSTTYHRAPWMPVTTPIWLPVASSCGPCSMCGSR